MTAGYYNIQPFGYGHFNRIIWLIAYSVTPVLFIHFTATFSKKKVKGIKYILWLFYISAIASALVLTYFFINEYAVEFLQPAGIHCHLDLPDHPPARPVGAEARHNLFLAVKEALTNVVRHSRATEIRFEITVTDAGLNVSLADNDTGVGGGPGGPLADGLRNMRQRMEEAGGRFRVESRPGGGTLAFFTLPIKAPK